MRPAREKAWTVTCQRARRFPPRRWTSIWRLPTLRLLCRAPHWNPLTTTTTRPKENEEGLSPKTGSLDPSPLNASLNGRSPHPRARRLCPDLSRTLFVTRKRSMARIIVTHDVNNYTFYVINAPRRAKVFVFVSTPSWPFFLPIDLAFHFCASLFALHYIYIVFVVINKFD